MWIDKPILSVSCYFGISILFCGLYYYFFFFLEFSIILGFVFLTRRSLPTVDDIGQGDRHLSFSFSVFFFSLLHRHFRLFSSNFKWICFNRTRNSKPHEGKNWLVLFFLLPSNRFHQPFVYKCLCLYAPSSWVCPLFLVYLNYCTVIISVLKCLISLPDWLFSLSPFPLFFFFIFSFVLSPSFRVYLNERWQLFIYQLFPLKKAKAREVFVRYFNHMSPHYLTV